MQIYAGTSPEPLSEPSEKFVKRTLVTGAGGFTGRYVGQLLAQRGHEVHGVVHEPLLDEIPGYANVHRADVCDASAVRTLVNNVRPDHVIHLAAIAFVAHSDVEQMYRTNILGTRNLLGALAQADRRPASVLVASSANIYGNAREGVLEEAMPPAPVNDYGVTKAATELIASIHRGSLPLIVTRPFNYTGRGQSVDFVIPKIVEHVRNRSPFIELGNLDVARDFSDVRTVADAYARLLESSEALGQTFNVCSGRAVTLRQVLTVAKDVSGYELEVRVNPAFVRPDEVRSLHGSSAKIERVIGPLVRIRLEDTLRWMLHG